MSFNLADFQGNPNSSSQWVSGILEDIEQDPESPDRFDDQCLGDGWGSLVTKVANGEWVDMV